MTWNLHLAYFCGILECMLFHVEVLMETQDITLSIPKEILLKVKLIAVTRQTSVSGSSTPTS